MLQILFDFFSGKAKTRIYTTFLGWLVICHLDLLFIAFLTDQTLIYTKTHQLKGEYLLSYILVQGWPIALLLETFRILMAAFLTYIMIWKVPQLLNEKSYRVELDVEYKLRKMKLKQDETLNVREEKVVNQQLQNIENEKKAIAERVKIEESPEQIKWDYDFDKFMQIKDAADIITRISLTVYGDSGNLYQYVDGDGHGQYPKGLPSNYLAVADTNGLVEITDRGTLLNLTDKGKYFIKRLSAISI